MASDTVLTISFIFSSIWRFFTSWYIPGTNVTPAAFAIFCLAVAFVIRVFRFIIADRGD